MSFNDDKRGRVKSPADAQRQEQPGANVETQGGGGAWQSTVPIMRGQPFAGPRVPSAPPLDPSGSPPSGDLPRLAKLGATPQQETTGDLNGPHRKRSPGGPKESTRQNPSGSGDAPPPPPAETSPVTTATPSPANPPATPTGLPAKARPILLRIPRAALWGTGGLLLLAAFVSGILLGWSRRVGEEADERPASANSAPEPAVKMDAPVRPKARSPGVFLKADDGQYSRLSDIAGVLDRAPCLNPGPAGAREEKTKFLAQASAPRLLLVLKSALADPETSELLGAFGAICDDDSRGAPCAVLVRSNLASDETGQVLASAPPIYRITNDEFAALAQAWELSSSLKGLLVAFAPQGQVAWRAPVPNASDVTLATADAILKALQVAGGPSTERAPPQPVPAPSAPKREELAPKPRKAEGGVRLSDLRTPLFATPAGQHLTPASLFHGEPVVLAYWATYCGPCLKEMPELGAISDKHHAIRFVGIALEANTPENRKEVHKIPADKGVHYAQYIEEDTHSSLQQVTGGTALPAFLVFDRHGQLKEKIIGALTGEENHARLESALEALESDPGRPTGGRPR